MSQFKKRLEKLEQQHKVNTFVPLIIVEREEELEEKKHLIGPETVVIIDDIGWIGW